MLDSDSLADLKTEIPSPDVIVVKFRDTSVPNVVTASTWGVVVEGNLHQLTFNPGGAVHVKIPFSKESKVLEAAERWGILAYPRDRIDNVAKIVSSKYGVGSDPHIHERFARNLAARLSDNERYLSGNLMKTLFSSVGVGFGFFFSL